MTAKIREKLTSAHPCFTQTSALSIRTFYPPFPRCNIRTSAYYP